MGKLNVFRLSLVVKEGTSVSLNVPQYAFSSFLDYVNLNEVEVRIVGCDVVYSDDESKD